MGGVPGAGGPKGPSLPQQTNGSQDQVTTVSTGETTLRQVAQRVGVSEEALKQANPQIKNPNQLKAGQDIRLPEKSKSKQDSSSSTTTKPQQTKSGGFKVPTYRKGDWEISPTVSGSTSNIADGEGSTQARRERRDQLDGMRPRDERDMDPAQIKKEKELARDKARKAADPVMQDIHKQMPEGKGQRDSGKAHELELREQLLKREAGRFRPPQNPSTQDKTQK